MLELPDVSDFDDDEEDDDLTISSADNEMKEGFVPPSEDSEMEIKDNQTQKTSPKQEKSTGAIKKRPKLSGIKPIMISRNQEAVRIVRKLVEYFVFHNSLPKREKEIHKQKLSEDLMRVLSQVIDDCCDNIFEQVLEKMESENIKSDKKVKTKNVACQTCSTGDIMSSSLLPQIDEKINLNSKVGKRNSGKNDIEAVVDLLNEHIINMAINNQSL